MTTVSVDRRVDEEAAGRGSSTSTVVAPVAIDPVAIDHLVRRIAADHPELADDTIVAAVVESLRQTDNARVHTFRLVLAERVTRERLVRRPCS